MKHLTLDLSQASALYEIATMATDGHDQQAIFEAIVLAVHDLTAALVTTLALIQEDGSLVAIAGSPGMVVDGADQPHAADASMAARAIGERRSILIDDRSGMASGEPSEIATRAHLAVPLIWQTEVLGVLTVACASPSALSQEHVGVIAALARQAAATVRTFRDRADDLRLQAEAAEIARQFAEQANHLEQVQEQLIQTEKLTAIAQLVHGLAHELNTPLSIVISNLTVLKQYSDTLAAIACAANELLPELLTDVRSAALAEPLAVALQDADLAYTLEDLPNLLGDSNAAAQRAAELVRSMGTFARGKTGWRNGVEIQEVLEAALTLADSNSPRPFPHVVRAYTATPPVLGFRSELGEVFLRLLTNAAQALEDRTGTIAISTACEAGAVVVRIRDTGCGIQAPDLGRVFDPFFTTRPASGGTGMGLAVCYGIVMRHGGSIALESEPGAGTTVTVTLPAAAQSEP